MIRADDFWNCEPVAADSGPYVLVVASEQAGQRLSVEAARAWANAGACFICAWGPDAEDVEETFDYSSFLPQLGEPLPFTLMTTRHDGEALEDALWFAFYNAKALHELGDGVCPVVIVVDSEVLEMRSLAWVRGNTE